MHCLVTNQSDEFDTARITRGPGCGRNDGKSILEKVDLVVHYQEANGYFKPDNLVYLSCKDIRLHEVAMKQSLDQ